MRGCGQGRSGPHSQRLLICNRQALADGGSHVPTDDELRRHEAAKADWSAPGVTAVHNRITVGPVLAAAAQADQPHQIDVCLVPLDGTEFAQLALVVATELAERLDVRIEIISAVAREEDVAVRYSELANVRLGTQLATSVVVDLDPPGVVHETLKSLGC